MFNIKIKLAQSNYFQNTSRKNGIENTEFLLMSPTKASENQINLVLILLHKECYIGVI